MMEEAGGSKPFRFTLRQPRGIAVAEDGMLRLVYIKERYDVFDFYFPHSPDSPGTGRSVYLDFASIGDGDVAVATAFVGKYGPLGLWTRKARELLQSPSGWLGSVADAAASPTRDTTEVILHALSPQRHDDQPESLEEFFAEVRSMKAVANLWTAYASRQAVQIIPALRSLGDVMNLPEELAWLERAIPSSVDPIADAEFELKSVIGRQLERRVWPTPEFGKSGPTQRWVAEDLLAAMYLMILLDMAGPYPPKRCGNPRCGKLFIPKRKTKEYCSPSCSALVRSWKARNKGPGGATGG